MVTQRVLVIGNSHVGALQRGLKLIAESTDGNGLGFDFEFINLSHLNFAPNLEDAPGGRRKINRNLSAAIEAAEPEMIVSAIGGNAHNIFGLVNHPEPFDFVLPEMPDLPLDAAATVIPYRSMLEMFRKKASRPKELLSAILRTYRQPRIHIESPPPVPSEDHLKRYPGVFKEKMVEHGVAPAQLRFKLWRVNSLAFREVCNELGIEFLPVPARIQDDDGMLRKQYWNTDPTHGNKLYGAEILRYLAVQLTRVRAQGVNV